MPKPHSANELRFQGNLLAADGQTVLSSGVWYGMQTLSSGRRDASQHEGAVTTHIFVFRSEDAAPLTDFGYVQDYLGQLYEVTAINPVLYPHAGEWTEVECQRVRAAS